VKTKSLYFYSEQHIDKTLLTKYWQLHTSWKYTLC